MTDGSAPRTFSLQRFLERWGVVVAFVLHRLFDITKPFPCRRLERLPAGLGIMADDWGAAAWMAAALTACRWCGWL